MFAVIKAKGYQFIVSQGDKVTIPVRIAEVGQIVEFDKVLMIRDNGNTSVGMPFIKGAKVTGKIVKTGRLPKVTVFKFRKRKKYRKKAGHKQDFCEIEITKIEQGTG